MSKHTPGEWFYDDQSGYVQAIDATDEGPYGIPIADLADNENEADARLIAAAPELLDAVKLLLDVERGGACQQGRFTCPAPSACGLPDSQPSALSWRLSDWCVAILFVGFVAGWALGAFL